MCPAYLKCCLLYNIHFLAPSGIGKLVVSGSGRFMWVAIQLGQQLCLIKPMHASPHSTGCPSQTHIFEPHGFMANIVLIGALCKCQPVRYMSVHILDLGVYLNKSQLFCGVPSIFRILRLITHPTKVLWAFSSLPLSTIRGENCGIVN